MPLFAGRILREEDVLDGWLDLEAGRVVAWGEGEPPRAPTATGWIVPAPVNAHTHIADTFLRGAPGMPHDLASAVGPGGWKHQRLAAATQQDLARGVARLAREMNAIGTAAFVDFREGGLAGIETGRRALQAAAGDPALDAPAEEGADGREGPAQGPAGEEPVDVPQAILLGRPAGAATSEDEAAAVAAAADGVGLSALRDLARPGDAEAWAEAAHRARKPFALHLSEGRREDVHAALALEPRFVVHATAASPADWRALADAEVPVVVCPRSNVRFGLRTPVAAMRAAGVSLAVGTDNGMVSDGNVLAELAQVSALDPMDTADLLRMATWTARRVAGLPRAWPPRQGQTPDLVVLPADPLPRPISGKPGFVLGGPA